MRRSALLYQPRSYHVHDVTLLLPRQLPPVGNTVPLFQAAPAASRGRVLRDKNGMPAPRRLFAVVGWLSRCETLVNEVSGMLQNDRQSFALQVFALADK